MEALVSIYKKSHSVAVEINVPADFDTIEKTSPGSNLSKKA